MSAIPDDYVDMLRALKAAAADFVIVGAYAVAANGYPRATADIDIFVRPDADNAERVFGALVEFGAPVKRHGLSARDFAQPGVVYQIGVPPVRIDILTAIDGVDYATASRDVVESEIGGVAVRFIGVDALIANKRASGRAKDLGDAEALEAIRDRTREPR